MTCRVGSASWSSQVHCVAAALEPDEDLVGRDTEVDFDAVAGSRDVPRGLLDGHTELTDIAGVDPVDAKQRGEGHTGNLSELGIGWEPEGYRVVPFCVVHGLSVPPGIAPAATIACAAEATPAGTRSLWSASMKS